MQRMTTLSQMAEGIPGPPAQTNQEHNDMLCHCAVGIVFLLLRKLNNIKLL